MPKAPSPTLILTHESLERMFAAFRVPLGEENLVLFGLRGSLPVKPVKAMKATGSKNAEEGWSRSVQLRTVAVDHIHMRCTLGIWDRRGKRVFAAPGSTVPHKDNVVKAAARKGRTKGRGTNQLEPGFYTDLTKGEHLQGKRNGHQALRQAGYRFYRRSLTGVPYRESSPLFYGNPYDNLHCGWNLDGQAPGFSSAGCMVVAGMPECPRREDQGKNLGPWKIFHDLLYAAPQKTFPILLAPARAALAALSPGAGKQAAAGKRTAAKTDLLLFGSEGEEVKNLQRKLAARGLYRGRITGHLDAPTYRAWKQPRK
jgi:hypothetical protein